MERDELRASYDHVAEKYAATFLDELNRKPFDRELLDAYADRLRGQGLVLEVGCGPGHIGRYLHDRGVEVAGVDLSPEMVAVARRLNPDMRFEVGDMAALDIEDASLAGIIAFYSVIHIPRDDVPGVLREFRRVLRAGGEFVISAHGGTGVLRREDFIEEPVPMEATLFERDELVGLIEGAGFRLAEAVQRAPYHEEAQTQRIYVRALVP